MDRTIDDMKSTASETPKELEERPALVDSALNFLQKAESTAFTKEEEEALVRKIDWMIMPLMAAVYFLQFLDKNLINFANVMGLGKDTNTTPGQYSYLALAFYVAYLVAEPLTGYLLQKLPVAKYLGVNVILWGICLALNCVCKDYTSLVALRVLLGIFEACVSPAMILVTVMWYKRREQVPRMGLWTGTVGLAIIVGALCSFGFQHYHGKDFKSWQIMFLVFGLVTIVIGVLVFLFLPDNPMSSRLTERQKVIAIMRLRDDTTGIENKKIKISQVFECLKDPHTWMICVLTTAVNIPNASVSSFGAIIIKSIGFNAKQAALLSIPSGVIAIIAIGGAAYTSFKFNIRSFVIIALLIPGIIGGALMAFLPKTDRVGRLIGNYLTNTIPSTTPIIYSWVAANFAGHTKKVTMNALLLMSFSLGNILGPLTFTGASAPNYIPAKITIVAVLSVAILVCLLLAFTFYQENKKRSRMTMMEEDGHVIGNSAFLDLTDRQMKEFRYII